MRRKYRMGGQEKTKMLCDVEDTRWMGFFNFQMGETDNNFMSPSSSLCFKDYRIWILFYNVLDFYAVYISWQRWSVQWVLWACFPFVW